MVIQQYSDAETRTENSMRIEDKPAIEDHSCLASNSVLQADSNNLPRGDSSFEVLARVGDSNLNGIDNLAEDSHNLLVDEREDLSESRTSTPASSSESNQTSAQNGPLRYCMYVPVENCCVVNGCIVVVRFRI